MNKIDITLKDFQPWNEWEPQDREGFSKDKSTGRIYSIPTNRYSSFVANVLSPFPTSMINTTFKILALITGSHFWWGIGQGAEYNFKARLIDASIDVARVVVIPFACIALEMAAIYGLFRPMDGIKLYASIERLSYEYVGRPSLQPENLSHPVLNAWHNPPENATPASAEEVIEAVMQRSEQTLAEAIHESEKRTQLFLAANAARSAAEQNPSPENVQRVKDMMRRVEERRAADRSLWQQRRSAEEQHRSPEERQKRVEERQKRLEELEASLATFQEGAEERRAAARVSHNSNHCENTGQLVRQ